MASVNKAIVLGNLGSDPEVRHTDSGTPVANLSVATNRKWTTDGQTREETEWHRVTVFGKTAENCGRYLSKGRQVYVEGRLQTREWEDRDGNKRKTTEIVAHTVQFLSGDGGGYDQSGGGGGPTSSFDDESIPF